MPDRDTVIAMAREAGFRAGHILMSDDNSLPFVAPVSATSCIVELERFAALVAAQERELCAKVCDGLAGLYPHGTAFDVGYTMCAKRAAADIRARKEET